MKIVLLADSRKNELLVNFCIAYSTLLANHTLYSLMNTATLLESSTELQVFGISTDYSGGFDQLASRTMFNEIDAVIYLRDTQYSGYDDPNPLLKACDYNSIPYATNLASAEILILSIDRGDLDWRELVRD
ncbi:MAG: methylglyoxal synthase [Clostridiales bacterium]|jgi:methylglyoxal synthase|nr:methylglyoxal synthase [Clostridiales bacterium]MDD4095105.1 methylglyoxal synthase [Oscillospiraceae bacterium]